MPQLKKKTVKLHKAKTSNEGQGTYVKKEAKNCKDCPHRLPQSITPSSSTHFSNLPKKTKQIYKTRKLDSQRKKMSLKQKLAKKELVLDRIGTSTMLKNVQ